MSKTSKCTKCEYQKENTFTPKGSNTPVTNYVFNVEFENGDKGLYNAKDKNDPKIKVGEETEYEVQEIPYTDKQGQEKTLNKISPARKPFGGSKETPEDRKKKASRTALGVSIDVVIFLNSNITDSQMRSLHNFFYTWLIEDIDDADKSKDRTTVLMTVARLMGSKNSPYDVSTSKKIIESAEKLLEFI